MAVNIDFRDLSHRICIRNIHKQLQLQKARSRPENVWNFHFFWVDVAGHIGDNVNYITQKPKIVKVNILLFHTYFHFLCLLIIRVSFSNSIFKIINNFY